MYTITTRLTMAITHVSIGTAGTRGPSATAVTQAHAAAVSPLLLLGLVIAILVIVVRVNYGLVSLVTQLVQLAAAVGRTLILIVLVSGAATVVLLHL